MPVEFVTIDRDTPYLFPPSVQDYLPEDHLARFVAEMVDQLDMSAILGVYAGKGKKPYHPTMLVALLFYGYATGTFSSRKLEKGRLSEIANRGSELHAHAASKEKNSSRSFIAEPFW